MIAYAPTRRLALLVAATAPAWLLSGSAVGLGVAVAVTLGVVALVLADVVRAPVAESFTVERRLPAVVGLGDEVEGSYEIASRWPHALRVRLFDGLPPLLRRIGPQGEPERIEAFGERSIAVRVAGRERGRQPLGPVVLRAEAPFGLVERLLRYEPEDRVAVAPSVAGIRRYRLL